MLDQLNPSTDQFITQTGLRVRQDLYDEDYSDSDYEQMLSMYEGTMSQIVEGEIVKSKVLRVTDNAVILDVGFKSEGSVPLDEFKDPHLLKEGDERLAHQSQIVLKPRNLELSATNSPDPADDAQEIDIERLWEQGYREDRIPNEVLDALRTGKRQSKHLSLALCKEKNGRLLYQNRVYVSDFASFRLRIIQDHHDISVADHLE